MRGQFTGGETEIQRLNKIFTVEKKRLPWAYIQLTLGEKERERGIGDKEKKIVPGNIMQNHED